MSEEIDYRLVGEGVDVPEPEGEEVLSPRALLDFGYTRVGSIDLEMLSEEFTLDQALSIPPCKDVGLNDGQVILVLDSERGTAVDVYYNADKVPTHPMLERLILNLPGSSEELDGFLQDLGVFWQRWQSETRNQHSGFIDDMKRSGARIARERADFQWHESDDMSALPKRARDLARSGRSVQAFIVPMWRDGLSPHDESIREHALGFVGWKSLTVDRADEELEERRGHVPIFAGGRPTDGVPLDRYGEYVMRVAGGEA